MTMEPLNLHERRTPDPYGHKRFLDLLLVRLESALREGANTPADRARRRGILDAMAIAQAVGSQLSDEIHLEAQRRPERVEQALKLVELSDECGGY